MTHTISVIHDSTREANRDIKWLEIAFKYYFSIAVKNTKMRYVQPIMMFYSMFLS